MTDKKLNCPKCGSTKVAAIAFGYPSPEMIEASDRGEIVLGGCCVDERDPD